MKLQTTQDLFNYWNLLRAGRPAPERREIDPTAIRQLLANTFILEVTEDNHYNFRLAGSQVCSAYCRELKNLDFLEFWSDDDSEAVKTMIAAVTEDAAVSIISFEGSNNRGWSENFELLMMPLRHNKTSYTRILGTLTPYDAPYWYGMYPVVNQSISGLKLIWPDDLNNTMVGTQSDEFKVGEQYAQQPRQASFLMSNNGRPTQYAHLSVIDGGKQ